MLRTLLKRDIGTLTGRTIGWDLAVKYFWKNPLLGYGVHDDWTPILKLSSAHNLDLQLIVSGGLVLLIIFFIICFRLENLVNKHKDILNFAISIVFWSLMLESISEYTLASNNNTAYIILAIAYCVNLVRSAPR
jgi:O-antigen ligase